MTPLAESARETLSFFDAQDIPLTLTEVRAYLVAKNLPQDISFSTLLSVFETELKDMVDSQSGFYFLRGRQELLRIRQERYKISLRRFRKARRFLYWLRFFPYLRAVSLSGSQALLNSNTQSDIDLFVITQKNRIWLARLLVSFYFQVLGQRRYSLHIQNRFCLNHYLCAGTTITQDKNLYTAIEYASLLPVLGQEVVQQFWQTNEWLREFLHEPVLQKQVPFFEFKFSRLQRPLELVLDFTIGPLLNWIAGVYQKRRIKLQDYIIVSDMQLSFHPGSRGQKVLARFQNRLQGFSRS
jgi:hypothetical protein